MGVSSGSTSVAPTGIDWTRLSAKELEDADPGRTQENDKRQRPKTTNAGANFVVSGS